MYLTYKDARLANFFLNLIEGTCNGTVQWTRHTTAQALPDMIKESIPFWPRILRWYDCRFDNDTLYLVVQCNDDGITTYALYESDDHQATRIKRATEYPGALDILNILALQVFEVAKTDQHEAVDALLDAVANIGENK